MSDKSLFLRIGEDEVMKDVVFVGSLHSKDILAMEPSISLKIDVMFCWECKKILKIIDKFAIPVSCLVWSTDLPELVGFAASESSFTG
jgi:hypothetical protein